VVNGCACADGTGDDDDADAAGGGSSVGGVGVPEPLSCGTAAASFWPSGGFQRGHCFASAESSGTSTISLSLRSQRLKQKEEEEAVVKPERNSHDILSRKSVSFHNFDRPILGPTLWERRRPINRLLELGP
jgi:hypothetical protein